MRLRLYHSPSLEFCLALVVGILVGRIYGDSQTAYLLVFAAAFFAVLFSTIPWRFRPLLLLFLSAGFVGINMSESVFEPPDHIRRFVPASKAEITGTVTAPINHFHDGYRFTLKADSLQSGGVRNSVSGLVSVRVYHGRRPPLPGDRVSIRAVRLKPVYGTRNVGGFDYVRYMKDRGIGVRTGMRNEENIRRVSTGSAMSPVRLGEQVRRFVIRFVDKNFPARTAPVAKAMTVAVTGEITPDTRQRFVASGLAHLLAISGLHVGFVSGLSFLIVSVALFPVFMAVRPLVLESGGHRKMAALVTLLVVALYVLAAGTRISALRAGIMVGVYFLSAAIGREKELLNALAISAIIVLLVNPVALFGPSFLLSYTAVMAIIFLLAWGGDKEETLNLLQRKKLIDRAGDFIKTTIMITIAVSLATAPIVLWFFNKSYFAGIFANVLAVPMAAVAIPSTFLGAFLDAAVHPVVGAAVAYPAVLAMDGIDSVTRFFSMFDGFSFESARPPFVLIALWYATLVTVYFRIRIWRYIAAAGLVAAIVVFNWPQERQGAEVHFFDVGQGDATLIMLKDGSTVLVDGGARIGGFDAGQILIKPLRELGVKKLDVVIATHDDSDHVGGLATLVKRMEVKSYYDNGLPAKTARMAELRRLVREREIPYTVLRAGMEIGLPDGSVISVLHPSGEFLRENPKVNDNNTSITLLLKTQGISLLLTGDLEKQVEKHLLKNGAALSADILKVPHHGSRTSSSAKFIKAVSPKYAVISAGQYNRFRHPSKEVTKRYGNKGITLYSTKEQGEVVMRLSDGEIEVSSYVDGD